MDVLRWAGVQQHQHDVELGRFITRHLRNKHFGGESGPLSPPPVFHREAMPRLAVRAATVSFPVSHGAIRKARRALAHEAAWTRDEDLSDDEQQALCSALHRLTAVADNQQHRTHERDQLARR